MIKSQIKALLYFATCLNILLHLLLALSLLLILRLTPKPENKIKNLKQFKKKDWNKEVLMFLYQLKASYSLQRVWIQLSQSVLAYRYQLRPIIPENKDWNKEVLMI